MAWTRLIQTAGSLSLEPPPAEPLSVYRRLSEAIGDAVPTAGAAIDLLILALLAGGHALIEGPPGVGKTALAEILAQALDCDFARIQMTPDLLPSDLVGTMVFNPARRTYEPRLGPLHHPLVLVDEINRATPKTQSAVLEAMAERQITFGGRVFPLGAFFMLVATQGLSEHMGTHPLETSQLDRFDLRIRLPYPEKTAEVELLDRLDRRVPVTPPGGIIALDQVLAAQAAVRGILVSQPVKRYIVDLADELRTSWAVRLGPSPRAVQRLYRLSQARAASRMRAFALPDDVKSLAVPVWSHRLVLDPGARLRKLSPQQAIEQALDRVAVPGSVLR